MRLWTAIVQQMVIRLQSPAFPNYHQIAELLQRQNRSEIVVGKKHSVFQENLEVFLFLCNKYIFDRVLRKQHVVFIETYQMHS
jgi:hypothetical protein